jgi:ElaB/YqjD/DUF883 family membrane-anchored ribosome-binding protein
MSATNEARAHAKDVAGDVDDMQHRIKDRATELVQDGKDAIQGLGTKVRSQFRDRPVASLVVAGSIGLLIGLLIGRKR